MPMKSDVADAIVLNFFNEQNRPLNSQNVADALQKFNFKKAAIQKVLDTLVDTGKISLKEYGKQKVYLARQDQFENPNNEERDQIKQENAKLQQHLEDQNRGINDVEGEIKTLLLNMTLDQILDKEVTLKKEVIEMEEKLVKLHEVVSLVRPKECQAVEKMYAEQISHWRIRKRMFKDLWDALTDNLPKNINEFKEELGIEYDEDVGVSLLSFGNLLPPSKKRPKYQ